jgi:endonuclease/exonuclease/phosphatase family metal-dependent hydrolase
VYRAAALLLAVFALPVAARELHIATWNLEWLLSPATAHASRRACDQARRAAIPCNATGLKRDSADFSRLAARARALDADVVALQEVEDATTAARVFRGYRFCFAAGAGVQQVGFAIRDTLPHRCEAPLQALTLGARHRAGALRTLWPGTNHAITLMSLHLKSGCSTDPLDSSRAACGVLSEQLGHLSQWLDSHSEATGHFVLLGDFNRAGPHDDDEFWQRLLHHSRLPLVDAAQGAAFRNCHRGQGYWQAIDHILVDPALARRITPGSYRKHGFAALEALRYRLSDHCPVSIRVSLPQ